MKKIRLGTSPVTGTIYAGTISKDGTHWTGEKQDVTEEAIRSVFEKMMQENKGLDNNVITYTYPSFGTLTFTPKEKESK